MSYQFRAFYHFIHSIWSEVATYLNIHFQKLSGYGVAL